VPPCGPERRVGSLEHPEVHLEHGLKHHRLLVTPCILVDDGLGLLERPADVALVLSLPLALLLVALPAPLGVRKVLRRDDVREGKLHQARYHLRRQSRAVTSPDKVGQQLRCLDCRLTALGGGQAVLDQRGDGPSAFPPDLFVLVRDARDDDLENIAGEVKVGERDDERGKALGRRTAQCHRRL